MKRVAFSNAFNADFKEEKHKRDKDGKFSKSGSGGSSSKLKGGASSKKEAKTEPSKAIPPMSNDVSLDHINSLMEYTGNSFSVNDGLRKGKLSEKDKKVVRHLDEVIASSKPTTADTTVYRGISADSDFAKKLASAKVGNTFNDKAFMSTSVDKNKAKEYAQDAANGEPKKGGVVLEINVPKGTKTANLSGEADINSNNEVILGRDSNIKVSSVTKKGETYVTVDLVKAQPAPKSEPKLSPPEPVSKVYRKQVETLIKSAAKEAKTLESLYSKLLSAKTAEEQSKLKGEVNKVVKKIKGLNIRPLNLRG